MNFSVKGIAELLRSVKQKKNNIHDKFKFG